ncbi:hypothetical protein KC725_05705 [Candidatus Peregrinibacteria bacterium]|nr:hypothetical protein [Candidatus Peregrinibacteria bacterium]
MKRNPKSDSLQLEQSKQHLMGERINQYGELDTTPIIRGASPETFSGGKIQKMILAAVMAAAPVLGSCAGEEATLYEDEIAQDTNETQSQKPKGSVNPYFTGYEWVYDGKYPETFTIEIYETAETLESIPKAGEGELIHTEIVIPDENNNFKVYGLSGEETTWTTAKTFNEFGEEIIIGEDPGPEGMYGLYYIPIGKFKSMQEE